MFERRLRIILLVLVACGGAVLLRAAQVQLVQTQRWRELAVESMKRTQLIDTTRGRILDVKGRELAVDAPCIDVCVDFRAIVSPPEASWVRSLARKRLRSDDAWRSADPDTRKALLAEQEQRVRDDIERMWTTLASLGGMTRAEMDEARRQIVQRVELRRRSIVYHRYQRALEQHEQREPAPWYRQWLLQEDQAAPDIGSFELTLSEQTDAHVILRNVDNATHVQLLRDADRYPGLVIRPGVKRFYPYGEVAAHTIGRLSKVLRSDLEEDVNVNDELRQYLPNDLIGRTGLEAIGEKQLRGTRGRIERDIVTGDVLSSVEARPGNDVRTTIDIELQATIEQAFKQVKFTYADHTVEHLSVPGAAVVIDIPTGEVRALVSHPTYDLNEFERLYRSLSVDELARPLMNRATQFALEPGSTVKPLVGLAALREGLITPRSTIECTGYLVLDGVRYRWGRCWTMSMFERTHQFGAAPHPTGHLTYTDAIERSCNVFFETLGDRLGIEGLRRGLRHFGLGRRVGIGLPEAIGRLPDPNDPAQRGRRGVAWFAAIGQDQVAATPLQIANAVAAIARRGVWMRPTLIPRGADPQPNVPEDDDRGTVLDLGLPDDAIAAAIEGMTRVVNSPAGTGQSIRRDDLLIAGKTGSAQAARLTIARRGSDGALERNERGGLIRDVVPAGTRAAPNPVAPWYRYTGKDEDELTHAWYVGFFPADEPRIAFAVFVEYGGSGGTAAGSVASQLIDACLEHGYVQRKATPR